MTLPQLQYQQSISLHLQIFTVAAYISTLIIDDKSWPSKDAEQRKMTNRPSRKAPLA